MPPSVDLLWWEGCPSTPRTRELLEELLAEAGLATDTIRMEEVVSEEQARRRGFVGSPTIRIDGRDVVPPPPDEPPSLTCRLYRLRDGRPSPIPDPDDIREALRRALGATESSP
ncbi:MAG: DF family (seleno)protein [Candidatus Dormibacteria bacterium]